MAGTAGGRRHERASAGGGRLSRAARSGRSVQSAASAGGSGIPEAAISAGKLWECLVPEPGHPGFALGSITCGGRKVRVEERDLLRKPFCTLKAFGHEALGREAGILLVAPLSGQYATLLRDTVAGLLVNHAVYITDWNDARQVPLAEGPFDLEDNISYVLEFLRLLPANLHVVAVCQSAVPALAAAALLAGAGDRKQPRSLILMGGLIDTRINPTRIDRWAKLRTFQWLERYVLTVVPPGFPGYLRPVYPANVQRLGLLAYIARHVDSGDGDPWRLRLRGDPTLAEPRFCRDLLTLMDVPAELFLSNVRAVLQDHDLPKGTMTWKGEAVNPAAIRNTALMTIEGEFDDISGRGQTYAAQALCRSIPSERRRHHLQRGVGHFGMYAGRSWFGKVLPRVTAFLQAQDRG